MSFSEAPQRFPRHPNSNSFTIYRGYEDENACCLLPLTSWGQNPPQHPDLANEAKKSIDGLWFKNQWFEPACKNGRGGTPTSDIVIECVYVGPEPNPHDGQLTITRTGSNRPNAPAYTQTIQHEGRWNPGTPKTFTFPAPTDGWQAGDSFSLTFKIKVGISWVEYTINFTIGALEDDGGDSSCCGGDVIEPGDPSGCLDSHYLDDQPGGN